MYPRRNGLGLRASGRGSMEVLRNLELDSSNIQVGYERGRHLKIDHYYPRQYKRSIQLESLRKTSNLNGSPDSCNLHFWAENPPSFKIGQELDTAADT